MDQILDDWDDGKDGNDLGVSPKDEGKRLLDVISKFYVQIFGF